MKINLFLSQRILVIFVVVSDSTRILDKPVRENKTEYRGNSDSLVSDSSEITEP